MLSTLTHPAEVMSSPILHLRREDAGIVANFVATLDDEALQMRFHGFTTPKMVRAHYDALDWGAAILTAWVADGAVRGLSEALLYRTSGGMEAEIALCVDRGWAGRGIGQALVAYAAAEAARCGAYRSIMVIASGDCEHANAARHLGATFDARHGFAVLVHAPSAEHRAKGRRG